MQQQSPPIILVTINSKRRPWASGGFCTAGMPSCWLGMCAAGMPTYGLGFVHCRHVLGRVSTGFRSLCHLSMSRSILCNLTCSFCPLFVLSVLSCLFLLTVTLFDCYLALFAPFFCPLARFSFTLSSFVDVAQHLVQSHLFFSPSICPLCAVLSLPAHCHFV